MKVKNAVILIKKEPGVTSFECLKYVKRNVNKKTGHCGTLDKFASGLIIALCGKYTKLNEKFMGLDKTYIAKIEFGKETDTLDPEGEIIATGPIPTIDVIQKGVSSLTGCIEQTPPVYSAIHVNGKRSYELVRSGKEVELKSRPVTVYEAEILEYSQPILTVRLHVSKGTYVRSWARDLGIRCNSHAFVTKLERVKIGPFNLSEAVLFNDENSLSNVDENNADTFIERLNSYLN